MSATITVPRPEFTPVVLPAVGTVQAFTPVRSSTLRHIVDAAVYIGAFRDKREVMHFVDHPPDTLTSDPASDGPSTIKVRWPASDRARWVFVAVRLQAGRSKGADAPELSARLVLLDDGSEVDKGMAWSRGALLPVVDAQAGFWPPYWVSSGARVIAGTEAETGPRLLNIDGNQGEWLELEVNADNARVLAVYLSEWPEAAPSQVFSA